MDPNCSAQEAVHCTLCTSSVATMFCEVCDINLCKDCIEIHVSDSSKVHKVVSLKQCLATLNYPKCGKHEKTCGVNFIANNVIFQSVHNVFLQKNIKIMTFWIF